MKEEFHWFLTDEFNKLLQGFKPSDNSEFIKAFCRRYNISLEEKTPPCNTDTEQQESDTQTQTQINYTYNCYECARVNHGNTYQTNPLSDYRRHWISSGHNGPCQRGQ